MLWGLGVRILWANIFGQQLIAGHAIANDFNHIVHKFHMRISAWKGKLLNRAGRVCLAKVYNLVNSCLLYATLLASQVHVLFN